ncbi:MDR family MFS transporter [Aspergillus novofumigatus IBT 16806]|uniref:Putative MFS transporter n=1 Tax=Aspergillus novofumigatus (strain IBT 16806) TaxID=1392255 RepID=A0A2I1CJG1_ASPN1|nr:putative MFS transporter [Aspergillus novofumigatus IBT 16806]PKX97765.1 putative MFS transporter [Aspergillus novofumigatus IBT 16806]
MAFQTITITYTDGKYLSLVDAASRTPLYHVKVCRQVPQMEMIRLTFPQDESAYFQRRVYTAKFRMTSLNVQLQIREHRDVLLNRKSILSTSYSFTSPAMSAANTMGSLSSPILTWEADQTGSLGDFRLINEAVNESDRKLLARFRNKAFSNEQVGTFEVDAGLNQLVKDEAVISGMLSMVQSINLADSRVPGDLHIDKHGDLDTGQHTTVQHKSQGEGNMETMEMMDSTAMPHRSKLKVFAIMVALSLSMFVAALDQTIMATAIPTIAAKLHSAAGYTWIGGAYLLANAAGACIWAKLSDIWGRKPILLLAVAWFFGSSIICATAVDMPMLIAGRALQGVAGGGLLQLVTIVISDLFSVRHRSLYLGLMEFMWALAGGIGPLLGGAFSQYVSWRWSYWVNLPVCGLAFVLLLLFLDVHNPKTKMMDGVRAIDWFGSLSILGLTLMLLLGLDFGGETFPWDSPKVICLIVFGSLCSLLFIYSEKRLAKYPLMPMGLFGQTSNIAILAVAFAHGFVFIAGEYYVPLYLQSVKEASPMRSGVLVLPLVLSEAFAGIITGAIIHRTGRYRELIWLGMTLLTIGNGLYIHLDAYSSLGQILGYQILSGIGAGFLFEPPIIAIQAMVSQDETATATATVGFIRNLATSASIVIGGVVFQNSMSRMKSTLLAAGMSETLMEQMSGDSAAANIEIIKTIQDATQLLAVKKAFASSLRNMWILYTCMSALGIVAGLFILKTRLNKEHVETRTGLKSEKSEAATVVQRPADEC